MSYEGLGKVPVENLILFVSNHLNCLGKDRRLLSIPRELLLTADHEIWKSVLHRLVLIMDCTSPERSLRDQKLPCLGGMSTNIIFSG